MNSKLVSYDLKGRLANAWASFKVKHLVLKFDDPAFDMKLFRKLNVERSNQWHGDTRPWTTSDWATAFAGEAGEVCDAVKKLNRYRDGIGMERAKGKDEAKYLQDLADEIADAYIYIDLLAHHEGIDLGKAIQKKFNEVSEKYGFPQRY